MEIECLVICLEEILLWVDYKDLGNLTIISKDIVKRFREVNNNNMFWNHMIMKRAKSVNSYIPDAKSIYRILAENNYSKALSANKSIMYHNGIHIPSIIKLGDFKYTSDILKLCIIHKCYDTFKYIIPLFDIEILYHFLKHETIGENIFRLLINNLPVVVDIDIINILGKPEFGYSYLKYLQIYVNEYLNIEKYINSPVLITHYKDIVKYINSKYYEHGRGFHHMLIKMINNPANACSYMIQYHIEHKYKDNITESLLINYDTLFKSIQTNGNNYLRIYEYALEYNIPECIQLMHFAIDTYKIPFSISNITNLVETSVVSDKILISILNKYQLRHDIIPCHIHKNDFCEEYNADSISYEYGSVIVNKNEDKYKHGNNKCKGGDKINKTIYNTCIIQLINIINNRSVGIDLRIKLYKSIVMPYHKNKLVELIN